MKSQREQLFESGDGLNYSASMCVGTTLGWGIIKSCVAPDGVYLKFNLEPKVGSCSLLVCKFEPLPSALSVCCARELLANHKSDSCLFKTQDLLIQWETGECEESTQHLQIKQIS